MVGDYASENAGAKAREGKETIHHEPGTEETQARQYPKRNPEKEIHG